MFGLDFNTTMAAGFILMLVLVLVFVSIGLLITQRAQKNDTEQILNQFLKLRESNRSLKAALEIQESFIANISHEIRTPLNAISGFSDLLEYEDELTPEEKEQYFRYIKDNVGLLLLMTNDMLSLSEDAEGTLKLYMKECRPAELLVSSVKSIERIVPQGVSLEINNDIPAEVRTVTDEARVRQIIVNLLTNSCKFTASGSIVVSGWLENGRVLYSVEDTGIGIPEEMRDAIFERFRKGSRYKQGLGIGLAACKVISKALGGNISLDDSYSGGSRFVFDLPL